jgi:hypothetical protein
VRLYLSARATAGLQQRIADSDPNETIVTTSELRLRAKERGRARPSVAQRVAQWLGRRGHPPAYWHDAEELNGELTRGATTCNAADSHDAQGGAMRRLKLVRTLVVSGSLGLLLLTMLPLLVGAVAPGCET